MVKKLIIDTDTGVDDAMALLMALESHKRGEVEVLAITAVNGNTLESHAQRNILRTLGGWEFSKMSFSLTIFTVHLCTQLVKLRSLKISSLFYISICGFIDLISDNLCLFENFFSDSIGCPDIPVYRGATEAMVMPTPQHENYHGEDGFNDVSFDDVPDISRVREEKAWRVISRLSQEYPGEVNLVAIGPLTNVAIAMLADPGTQSPIELLHI